MCPRYSHCFSGYLVNRESSENSRYSASRSPALTPSTSQTCFNRAALLSDISISCRHRHFQNVTLLHLFERSSVYQAQSFQSLFSLNKQTNNKQTRGHQHHGLTPAPPNPWRRNLRTTLLFWSDWKDLSTVSDQSDHKEQREKRLESTVRSIPV